MSPKPKPQSAALTLAERAQLIQEAPTERGDHLVSLHRRDQAPIFGVVRVDGAGRRLVSVALTAIDAQAKAQPAFERPAPKRKLSPWHSEAAARGAEGRARKSAAEIAMRAEVADYKRACAAAGIAAPKLLQG
jgi:hypothetical protein